MTFVADRGRRDWINHWRAMHLEELYDERWRLYDAADVAEPNGELLEFVRWALTVSGGC